MTRTLSLLTLALVACGEKDVADDSAPSSEEDREVTVTFAATLGGQPVACGVTAEGVGVSGSAVSLQDLRFYVHDLRLVDADGVEAPVTLDDDDVWQDGVVALIDFEDATAGCANGTGPVNVEAKGRVAEGEYVGLRFTLGVPFELNHADPATAESPLNLTTMHWNWQGGYKFLRLDLSTEGFPEGWFVHLGSTGCEADGDGTVTGCSAPNRPEMDLSMDVDSQVVKLDLDALLDGVDLDQDGGGAQGCMSMGADPECPPLFEALGLGAELQRAFVVE
ncbi:MAG: metallo-mystery pair system four-Cys motif protein [Alphaproteobacteria bacterium]|nr:metallo-mystery pair system four-Cys motif protein [Alphaproteobacteria bacterium]MCB9795143.1 metallo-mystery pair system four-Cys motif protein [Alphaproteobacteria bacterium]